MADNDKKDENLEHGSQIVDGENLDINSVGKDKKPFNLSHEGEIDTTSNNEDRKEPVLENVETYKEKVKVNIASSSMKKKLIISPFPKNFDKVEAVMAEQRAYLIESGAKTDKEQLSTMTGVAFGLLGCYDELAEIIGIEKLNEMINKPLITKPRLV